jgi:CheY-like chemotaxis protein
MTGKRPRSWPEHLVVSAARERGALLPDVGSQWPASVNAASLDAAPLQPATSAVEVKTLELADAAPRAVMPRQAAAHRGRTPPASISSAESSSAAMSSAESSSAAMSSAAMSSAAMSSAAMSSAAMSSAAISCGSTSLAADAVEPGTACDAGFEPRRALPTGLPERPMLGRGLAELGMSVCSDGLALARAQPAPALLPIRRALVVDDDPEVRRALARFLRPELEVCLAGSVADARVVVAGLDRLDVAFVDWELPDGTGEQILEWLSRWPDAIRVLISARFASSASAAPPPPGTELLASSVASDGAAPHAGPGGRSGGKRCGDPLRRSDPLQLNPLKNRALANLVLGKPVATSVIEALKRAALALPHA